MATRENTSVRKQQLKAINYLCSLPAPPSDYTSPSGTLVRYRPCGGEVYKERLAYPDIVMNNYARESLRAIGGGALKLSLAAEEFIRISGGRGSIHNNLLRYENASTTGCLHVLESYVDIDVIVHELFGKLPIKMFSYNEMLKEYRINTGASTGVATSKHYLTMKRGYYMNSALIDLTRQFHQWHVHEPSPFTQWRFPWSISTRGKLIKIEDALTKLSASQPVSRVVSLPHPSEHFLSYKLYMPINKRIITRLRYYNEGHICIGIRKNKYDWRLLGQRLAKYSYSLCLDWKRFDTTVSKDLLVYAFRVMRSSVSDCDENDFTYLDNLETFFMNNFVFSRYIYDGTVYDTDGGIPSGSIWTSIVGSIVNYVILRYIFTSIDVITDFDICVYGDDAIVGFNTTRQLYFSHGKRSRSSERIGTSVHTIMYLLKTKAKQVFGLDLSDEDSYICDNNNFNVGYKVPVYSEYSKASLLRGTSAKKVSHYIDVPDPFYSRAYSKGITHRWEYNFRGRPKFLKRYWDKFYRPIAPTFETIQHLVNTERPVKTLSGYREILLSNICDNVHNLHVYNYGFHLFYDLDFLRSIPKTKDQGSIIEDFSMLNVESSYRKMLMTKVGDDSRLTTKRVFYRRSTKFIDLNNHVNTSIVVKHYALEVGKRTGHRDGILEISEDMREAYYDRIKKKEEELKTQWEQQDKNYPIKSTAQRYISFYMDKERIDRSGFYKDALTKQAYDASVVYGRNLSMLSTLTNTEDLKSSFFTLHWMHDFSKRLYGLAFSDVLNNISQSSSFPMFFKSKLRIWTISEKNCTALIRECYKDKLDILSLIFDVINTTFVGSGRASQEEVRRFGTLLSFFKKIVFLLDSLGLLRFVFVDERVRNQYYNMIINKLKKLLTHFKAFKNTAINEDNVITSIEEFIIFSYSAFLSSRKRKYMNIFGDHFVKRTRK